MSKRRRSEQVARREVVAQVHYRDRVCQAPGKLMMLPVGHVGLDIIQVCSGPLDVHEIIPRSAWPKGYLDPGNCILVCRRHHNWIGDHPRSAALVGLHKFSWDRT